MYCFISKFRQYEPYVPNVANSENVSQMLILYLKQSSGEKQENPEAENNLLVRQKKYMYTCL